MAATNENIRIDITENGTTTLATAGKYCDRNIDVSVDKVYEAGQIAEREAFWNTYVRTGNYWVYRFAGWGWMDSIFQPTKDIVVTGSANGLFRETGIRDIAKCLADNNVVLDLSGATTTTYLFGFSNDLQKVSMKISEPNEVSDITFVSSSFQSCTNLTTLSITGILATNGLDLHWSPLDKASLLNIIDILQDRVKAGLEGTLTVTLGSTNLAKLTDTEKAIATQKGWSLV